MSSITNPKHKYKVLNSFVYTLLPAEKTQRDMAPIRPKKRKSDPTITNPQPTNSPSRTPIRSPSKRAPTITLSQKQALIDNLQLEGSSLPSQITQHKLKVSPNHSDRTRPQTPRPIRSSSPKPSNPHRATRQPHPDLPPQSNHGRTLTKIP